MNSFWYMGALDTNYIVILLIINKDHIKGEYSEEKI